VWILLRRNMAVRPVQTDKTSAVHAVQPVFVGYIADTSTPHRDTRRTPMKVSDILRVKGNALYTVSPEEPLAKAIAMMAEKDMGSLVVMFQGDMVGMLTFREVMQLLVKNDGVIGGTLVRAAVDGQPLTCNSETELDDVRRMMLDSHARYMPVMDQKMLMGVISFYDVAKAVVDSQNFENKMLKAYIRDWPSGEEESAG